MEIARGPILFATTGIDPQLKVLPRVAQLAARLDRQLVVLHTQGKRYTEYAAKQVAAAVAALPGDGHEIIAVAQKDGAAKLRELAYERGGIFAQLPERRGFFSRLLMMITGYEAFLVEGPVPLLALPAGDVTSDNFRRVLFPIDLSPRSLGVLDETIALCKALGADLHLIHLFGADRLLPNETDSQTRQAARTPKDLFALDKAHMQQLADRARQQGVTTVLEHAEGRAHSGILTYIAQHRIDLVIMATHGPRSSEDIWRGSTTARVIQRSPVPVIAVRS